MTNTKTRTSMTVFSIFDWNRDVAWQSWAICASSRDRPTRRHVRARWEGLPRRRASLWPWVCARRWPRGSVVCASFRTCRCWWGHGDSTRVHVDPEDGATARWSAACRAPELPPCGSRRAHGTPAHRAAHPCSAPFCWNNDVISFKSWYKLQIIFKPCTVYRPRIPYTVYRVDPWLVVRIHSQIKNKDSVRTIFPNFPASPLIIYNIVS